MCSEDVGDGHEIWWVDGLCTVRMWEMRWERDLVRVTEVGAWVHGVTAIMYI